MHGSAAPATAGQSQRGAHRNCVAGAPTGAGRGMIADIQPLMVFRALPGLGPTLATRLGCRKERVSTVRACTGDFQVGKSYQLRLMYVSAVEAVLGAWDARWPVDGHRWAHGLLASSKGLRMCLNFFLCGREGLDAAARTSEVCATSSQHGVTGQMWITVNCHAQVWPVMISGVVIWVTFVDDGGLLAGAADHAAGLGGGAHVQAVVHLGWDGWCAGASR